jgi:hypothetical protein
MNKTHWQRLLDWLLTATAPLLNRNKKAAESFVGSAGILIVGFLSIPIAAWFVGANVSSMQGLGMGGLFFLARWAWLYIVRTTFERL